MTAGGKALLAWFAWFALWTATWPALLATFQAIPSNAYHAAVNCRQDLGVAMLIAAAPPSWVVVPFVTGFWEHGFQFGCPK